MVIRIKILISAFFLLFLLRCQKPINENVVNSFFHQNTIRIVDPIHDDIGSHGRDNLAEKMDQIFTLSSFDSLPFPDITPEFVYSLEHQLKLLKLRKQKPVQKIDNLDITIDGMRDVIKKLIGGQFSKIGLDQQLSLHQLKGNDEKGNVYFTGYFTPVLQVRKERDDYYKYPLYRKPESESVILPSRSAIDGEGILDDQGLELAWANNKIDVYFMQVQGSGIVQYKDGSRELFGYGGGNGHPYRSIGKYMIENEIVSSARVSIPSIKKYFKEHPEQADSVLFTNPNYIFFKPADSSPKGAGHVPLTKNISIAVDRKYIPLGSCLLAQIPIINSKGHFSHHEFRFLLAQDVGGAINGPGHVDLYTGIGHQSKKQASALHHYGKLWLVQPNNALTEMREGEM